MTRLDDETLKEVGRFAIEFNDLDLVISGIAEWILECAEFETSEQLTPKTLELGRKLERIRTVSRSLADKYALGELHGVLTKQIDSANCIIGARNTVFHGSLIIKAGQPPTIQAKQQMELTPNRLSELVRQIDDTLHALATAYFAFMDAVYKAREAAVRPKKPPPRLSNSI